MYKAKQAKEKVVEEAAAIQFSYIPSGQAEQLLHDQHLMALIDFNQHVVTKHEDTRRISVSLAPLDGNDLMLAIVSRDTPSVGEENGVTFSYNRDAMFGYIALNEDDFDDIHSVAKSGYDAVVRVTQKMGFPHLLRVWNFLPDINQEITEMERYRSFCTGRYEALISVQGSKDFPAASAIGSQSPGVLIFFLAAKQAGLQIENPRQKSAFEYPKQFGPTSPSFSRATLTRWGQEQHLYISGTASIVGYESMNSGDTLAQLRETLKNLESLIANCKTKTDIQINRLTDLSLVTVYLRHESDYAMVKTHLEFVLGQQVPVIYLNGDICRNDLALEIEAIYIGP